MGRKSELEPVARQLFAGGMGLREVSQALGLHQSTVTRWRNAAADRWKGARQDAAAGGPEHLVTEIEKLIASICRDASLDPIARADALLKAVSAQEALLKRLRDPIPRLKLLRELIAWGHARLRGEAHDVLMRALQSAIEDVRPAFEQGKDLAQYANQENRPTV